MTPQIIEKLQSEITAGISKESQVVYLLAGIRKIIEQEDLPRGLYFYLRFHCDWALHSQLYRRSAQYILSQFNSAHLDLMAGAEISPNGEIEAISKMERFRDELSEFLQHYSITDITKARGAWPKFLHLYGRVIEDVPLVIRDASLGKIDRVNVTVETAKEVVAGQKLFRVSWHVTDKSGKSGTIFVIHTYEADD